MGPRLCRPAVWAGSTCLRAGCASRPPQGLWLFWGCRPSVPSTGTELGAGSVGLGARYCRVLRALGWAGATPPAYAARVWGLWAGGCRMCEAVLSVERGRMHVGLLTVGVPYMHRMEPPIPKHLAEAPAELLTALTALTVPGALVASLPDDASISRGRPRRGRLATAA